MSLSYHILRKLIMWLSVIGLVIGMFYSRAFISIGTVALFMAAMATPSVKTDIKTFCHQIPMLAITALFGVYLLSYFSSANKEIWLGRLEINLPYLLLPFGFYQLRPVSKNNMMKVLGLYWALCLISVIHSLSVYFFDFENSNSIYRAGRVMFTPLEHVRFAIMIALGFFTGGYILSQTRSLPRWLKTVLYAGTGLMFVYIHLLAARNGLLSLYAGLLFLIGYYIIKKGKLLAGTGIVFLFLLMPLLALRNFPSFSNKWAYMKWDYEMYRAQRWELNTSDMVRLSSIDLAWEIIREKPLLGAGFGDLRGEMDSLYQMRRPGFTPENRFLPISEFAYIGAGAGFLGLLLFLVGIFIPLLIHHNYRNVFFSLSCLCIYITFFTETTIELQRGKTLFLFFILLQLVYLESLKCSESAPV